MKILDKDFEPRYNLRAMFIMEEITGKPFKVETLFDSYVLFYSCLMANQENPALEFNEFIDYCSDHKESMEEFNRYMNDEMKSREMLGSKKKVRKKN